MNENCELLSLKASPPPALFGYRRIWNYIPGTPGAWSYRGIPLPVNIDAGLAESIFPDDYHPPVVTYYMEVVNDMISLNEVQAEFYQGELEPWEWNVTWEMWIPAYMSNVPGNMVNTKVLYLQWLEYNHNPLLSWIEMEMEKQAKALRNFTYRYLTCGK